MNCPRCRADLPAVAHFCQRCGLDVQSGDSARGRSFAVKPDERVASFNLVSTIMPRGSGQRPTTYTYALVAFLVIALLAAIFGALPIAILVAVIAIPLVYIVYLYDVNLWDDEPVPVTLLAFGLTFVLGIGFTMLWTRLLGAPTLSGGTGVGFEIVPLLVWALLVPIVGEAIRQVGPVILASRPRFDDLMDGLTFGVISGVAYSAAETLVLYWPTLVGGYVPGDTAGSMLALIFLQGFVKPLIFGTATGIACAEFSGLGKGYDGFTPRYFRGVGEALVAVVAFYLGVHLIGLIPEVTTAAFLSVLWGLLILGVLVIRVRTVLHTGLLEAALESAARESGVGHDGEPDVCARCEMPLLSGAAFCTACGAAVRAQGTKPRRGTDHGDDAVPPAPAGAAAAEAAPTPGDPAAATAPGATMVAEREWSDGDAGDSEAEWQTAPDAASAPADHPAAAGDVTDPETPAEGGGAAHDGAADDQNGGRA